MFENRLLYVNGGLRPNEDLGWKVFLQERVLDLSTRIVVSLEKKITRYRWYGPLWRRAMVTWDRLINLYCYLALLSLIDMMYFCIICLPNHICYDNYKSIVLQCLFQIVFPVCRCVVLPTFYCVKGALNPNFLNLTKNKEHFYSVLKIKVYSWSSDKMRS